MNLFYLKRSLLFEGCSQAQIEKMLVCFGAEVKRFKKNEVIKPAGTYITRIGLVLEGSVRGEHTDAWGKVTILTITEAGKTFGESHACAPSAPSMVDFVANEDCQVVFMTASKMMHRCPHRCDCHLKVSTNLTELIALRNLSLSRRTYILAHQSTRGKVLAFLSLASKMNDSMEFDLPLNREQMANYLGVDRSALSAELSRMKKEGLLDFRKNHFKLARKLGEEDEF